MTSQPNSPTAPPVRILIVDDQPANLQVLGTLLDQRGYDVVPAPDGAAALRRLAIRPPDLVLLDVMMPGMNGFEVCRQIREQRTLDDLPVIFLSAADDKEVIVRALESGGVDYVTKPFNPAELLGRVKTHLALKAARDRLRQLAQDKDELLGLLAHDLKNALGSVQMSSQLLAERTVSDTRLHRLSVNIQEAADRTLAFVNQFLANTATERGLTLHPVAMDLAQTAAGVVQEYASRAQRKGIRLHMDPPPAPAPVHADPGALRQVLDNLVSNAVKFSPPDRTVQVSVTAEPGHVECRIRDEGPGFTEEDRGRMFQRYGRLSARPTGNEPSTGLGLSIVRQLVTLLRADLQCDTAPGRGTTFILRLPRA